MPTDWAAIFEPLSAERGATEQEIRSLKEDIARPLSREELSYLKAEGAPDVEGWQLISSELPSTYLDFLRWSNGGVLRSRRLSGLVLDPVLATSDIRENFLAYWFPYWMPGALPISFDGAGGFFVLDLRTEKEAPVYHCSGGDLDWTDAERLASSFIEGFT